MHRAYILHHYPYQEHGVLLKVFSEQYGLLPVIAKGAKRPKSPWYGVLAPFNQLSIEVAGKGDVKSLRKAELGQLRPQLSPEGMLSALYLNELLLQLCPEAEPMPELYELYSRALPALAAQSPDLVLREFEWHVLNELGYGLALEADHEGLPIHPEYYYHVAPGELPHRVLTQTQHAYLGQHLLNLQQQQWDCMMTRRAAKVLLAAWLDFYTHGKLGKRRAVLRQMMPQVQGVNA